MHLATYHTTSNQIRITIIALCLLLASANVFALGAGEIEIHTRLHEPLNATIPLDISKTELETLEVRLAPEKTFKRIAMRYHPDLETLNFAVIKNNGTPYIKITSSKPMREPILELALLISWGNGKILKEYPITLIPSER